MRGPYQPVPLLTSLGFAAGTLAAAQTPAGAPVPGGWKFDFGTRKAQTGFIVQGIHANKWGLAEYLVSDDGPFDPAHPDSVAQWNLPPSPFPFEEKPEGN